MTRLYIVLLASALLASLLSLALTINAESHSVGGVSATAYCLKGRMADGTFTRPNSAAHNGLRLGTKIRLVGKQAGPGGLRRYVIRDRIGHGTQLDLWTGSCGDAIRFGRRVIRFKIGWGG